MGRPKKIVEDEVKEVKNDETKKEEIETPKADVLKPALPPLNPGEAYFEDGPSGTILVGDASRDQIWFRAGNRGKGCWINKKR